ncbi:hypothetical protein DFJ77DRAFT_287059 [Powellomyces hirtus]|nr:hypothetical protein DFJ77DRAFT_287059 [Powellomyces hirtus]
MQLWRALGTSSKLFFHSDSVPDGRTVGYYAIPFADRQWIMHCWGHSKTIAAPWVTFAFIILFCIAAALLTRTCILRNQGRRRKKETNVINNPRMSERQVDWMRTNAFSILNAIRDPLLIIDREGYVIDGNDDALLLTKYRVEDLIFGIHISKMFPGIMGSTSKDKMKDKHPVKVSHPPGPWTSSCPLPNLDGSPGAGQKEGNVVIDVDSTYLDLQETGTARDPSINTQDDKLLPGMQEVTLKTKDGRDLLVEANFSPYIDCQDQKEKIQMVLFRDVSLWKSLIKDTVEAKELAEASRNEISDYLSFVCHELRNPLHVIIGLSSLLTQSISALDSGLRSGIASPTSPSALSPLSPASSEAPVPQVHAAYQEAIEHLASISDSTRTMKNILNDTRVLSKVENRTVEFEKTNIDLRQLLQRIHRAQATYRDSWWMGSTESLKSSQVPEVEFKLVIKGLSDPSPMLDSEQKLVGLGMSDVSPDMPSKEWFPPIVKTDSARLTQVLTNIVTNAFEHTVKGSVTLRAIVENVRLYDPCNSPSATERRRQMKDSKPTKQVLIRFEVEDTGRGIAKAVMPKLFRMYSQNSVDRALGSTGLSLNVIYALLSLMGSELQAFSTVGQGTTVWFSLWFDLPDEYKLDEQESDAEFKGWSVGSQFITDVFLGRRESIYQPVGKKEKESYEKRISRHASSTSNAELQHSTSGDFCSGNTSASPSSDRRSPATIDAMVGRNSPEILRAHSTSPLGGESSRDLSRAATVSTKPSISRIHSGDGSLAHLTGGPSRANTLTADLRRGSQSGERKGKVARKTPNPAVRRLGTHPLRDRPIRVLVVEDNEVLLKIAGTTLARAGFEVKQAINGDQAIQRVVEMGEKYFDVVLMDLLMPVMDGFQATEEIRRRGWTMPVIALTAKTLESDRLRCFKIGFNYFMTKPFQLGDIATVIRFMVGAEAEQKAQAATDGASTNQPTYGGPWSKFT